MVAPSTELVRILDFGLDEAAVLVGSGTAIMDSL